MSSSAHVGQFLGTTYAKCEGGNVKTLPSDMRANTQALPVETWETEPELTVVAGNGAKVQGNSTKGARTLIVIRGNRAEMEVLGWEARIGRLVSLARNR